MALVKYDGRSAGREIIVGDVGVMVAHGDTCEVPDEIAASLVRQGGFTLVGSLSDLRPALNASRDDWAAYAETIGVEVSDDDKRADIITRVDAEPPDQTADTAATPDEGEEDDS